MAILIDTNILVAYAFSKDTNHVKAVEFIGKHSNETKLVVSPVLSELFYLITVRVNYRRAIEAFDVAQRAFQIEPLLAEDMAKMRTIMMQYQNVQFDFTDVSIMAVSERLNITRIATFDRRDFSVYRPQHCDYYELLP